MASDREILNATTRTSFGSRSSRRLRREGQVPGVVYADGSPARPFQVPARSALAVLGAGHALFDLEIEGQKAVPVVIKEQQQDLVRGDLEHLDLQEVRLDVKIQASVWIELEGAEDAPGVKEGGILEHVTHEVTVEALPADIPDSIKVDVSGMEMHETVALDAVETPEGVDLIDEELDQITVATLSPPRVEAEPDVAVEEEAEVIGEGGEPVEGDSAEESGASGEG